MINDGIIGPFESDGVQLEYGVCSPFEAGVAGQVEGGVNGPFEVGVIQG